MQEPILKDFLDENLYLYVILGESLDSIDVTRIDLWYSFTFIFFQSSLITVQSENNDQ
jgi:hypothetical protein